MKSIRNQPAVKNASSSLGVLGTPLELTSYDDLTLRCHDLLRYQQPWTIDFSNTQIVTMRRHDMGFREITDNVDFFVPDGMPLIWCLNFQSAGLEDRVYGPTFMNRCVSNSTKHTHYFLGGSDDCLMKLRKAFLDQNPELQIVQTRNGYFKREQELEIIDEINRLSPDFIWVGLGTPKQQDWIHRNRKKIRRGIIMAVGFAFDVNAGTKPDAPHWMQRLGLTWVFRMCSEPMRLVPRYLRYNSLFLFYLIVDGLRGRAFASSFTAAMSHGAIPQK